MSRFDHKIKTPKIVLTGVKNFPVFLSGISTFARAAGVGDIFYNTREVPEEGTNDRAIYDGDHEKLKNVLLNCLSSDIQLEILGALDNDASFQGTITWLINEYGPAQNDSNQDLVLEAIKSLKLANFESFDEYYGSLKQLFSRYVSV